MPGVSSMATCHVGSRVLGLEVATFQAAATADQATPGRSGHRAADVRIMLGPSGL
jgi:hypothetical protein